VIVQVLYGMDRERMSLLRMSILRMSIWCGQRERMSMFYTVIEDVYIVYSQWTEREDVYILYSILCIVIR